MTQFWVGPSIRGQEKLGFRPKIWPENQPDPNVQRETQTQKRAWSEGPNAEPSTRQSPSRQSLACFFILFCECSSFSHQFLLIILTNHLLSVWLLRKHIKIRENKSKDLEISNLIVLCFCCCYYLFIEEGIKGPGMQLC